MLIRQLETRKAKMIEQHVSRGRRHPDTANSDIFAEHSFPARGLVALSRIAYQRAPLAVLEIRPGVFVFSGAGGNVTALSASEGCAVIDTGYSRPRRGNPAQHRIRASTGARLADRYPLAFRAYGWKRIVRSGRCDHPRSFSIHTKQGSASRRNARPTSVSRAPCPGSGWSRSAPSSLATVLGEIEGEQAIHVVWALQDLPVAQCASGVVVAPAPVLFHAHARKFVVLRVPLIFPGPIDQMDDVEHFAIGGGT